MLERLKSLFDKRKMRMGAIAVCLIAAVAGMAWAFAALGANNEGMIDNIALLDVGNSYYLEGGKLILSYNHGQTTAEAPLVANTYEQEAENDHTVYMSAEVTAVAYGGGSIEPSIKVLISNDLGKTWNNYLVTGAATTMKKFIGFTTKDDGWLVIGSGVAMGHQENRIFLTSDGGKTWHEIGNSNNIYARVLTGAGFANGDIGFLSFRYETDFQPAICWTQDGGLTWEKLYITLPEKYDEYSKTPLSPLFYGAKGLYPIQLSKGGASNVVGTIYLTSDDFGRNWTFDNTTAF